MSLPSYFSRKMKRVTIFGVAFLLLTSCFSYKDVNYQGVENFKMGKIQDGQLTVNFDLKLDNPNKYKIKIKPTELLIFLGEKEFATASLDKKLVIQKRSSLTYPIQIKAKLKNVLSGGFGGMMDMVLNKSAEVRIKGPVKGSVYGFSRKMMVDEARTIDLSDFKLPFFN